MSDVGDLAIRFNVSRARVQSELAVIAHEWAEHGITTPVVRDGQVDPDAVAQLPFLGPEELTEGRGWLADCGVYPLTDAQVERLIARHYSGGIAEFIRNTHGG